MKRLVFIVEGDTEIILVEKIIVPYLISLGFSNAMHAQTIITNRKQHKKGGVQNYEKFKNEIIRTLAQGNVIVTTLIDFFRLPTDFPNYSPDATKIDRIEILDDFDSTDNLVPYIQLHELEALMFSGRDGFELVIDDEKKLKLIDDIFNEYTNPEDINSRPEKAPSKRMAAIFNYDKTSDGALIFEMLGIKLMLDKCPRFNNWIKKIIEKLEQ